ncbi:MAG: hypothetical protein K6D96_06215 [Acetatifactor sp.]|nr:hypothetical protein [Acetatifactor sp.]
MTGFKNLQSKRFAAGIMAMMMLVIVLFSISFIAAEADHDCSGDDCPICAGIRFCENTLEQISNGAAVQSVAVIPATLLCISILFSVCVRKQNTPVSLRVRLNN